MRIQVFLVPLAFALLFAVPEAVKSEEAGQEPAPAPSRVAAIPQTAAGELSKVDPRTMSFWIKAAGGQELEFKYTGNTEVTGAADSAEGLASMSGARVTVRYSKLANANVASRIEVLPRT